MYDLDKSKRRIVVIDAEIAKLKVEAATLLEEVQRKCLHPIDDVVEAVYEEDIALRRRCALCGLEEVGIQPTDFKHIKDARVRIEQHKFKLRRVDFLPGIRFHPHQEIDGDYY